jgi:hypothetical protein
MRVAPKLDAEGLSVSGEVAPVEVKPNSETRVDWRVDYPAVLAPLGRAGYGGWLVVEAEQDPAKAHPLTYARMGFDHLKKTAPAASLAV